MKSKVISEKVYRVKTAQGAVDLKEYSVKDVRCLFPKEIKVGEQVEVVAGKKIPIGTIGEVEYVKGNDYSREVVDGQVLNPSVLLREKDGTKIWTYGKNLKHVNIPGKISEELNEDEVSLVFKKYVSDKGMWYQDETGALIYQEGKVQDLSKDVLSQKSNNGDLVFLVENLDKKDYEVLTIGGKFEPGNFKNIKSFHTLDEARKEYNSL